MTKNTISVINYYRQKFPNASALTMNHQSFVCRGKFRDENVSQYALSYVVDGKEYQAYSGKKEKMLAIAKEIGLKIV